MEEEHVTVTSGETTEKKEGTASERDGALFDLLSGFGDSAESAMASILEDVWDEVDGGGL